MRLVTGTRRGGPIGLSIHLVAPYIVYNEMDRKGNGVPQ